MSAEVLSQIIENWHPAALAAVFLSIVPVIILTRYFVVTGAWFGVSMFLGKRAPWRRLQPQPFTKAQILREIGFSSLSALTFTAVVGVIILMTQAGWTQIYRDPAEYGMWWFWLQVPVLLIIQDFYFYWMHRAIHQPGIYDIAHKVHHLSTNPTSFSAFAFHPIEAVLEIGIFFVLVMVLPLNVMALGITAILSLVYNAYGHLGYEIMPRVIAKSPVGWVLNKSAYHNQHHRTYRYNYGLYTTLWDRLFGTFHPDAEATYDRATTRPAAESAPKGTVPV